MKKIFIKVLVSLLLLMILNINVFMPISVFAFTIDEIQNPEIYSKGTCEKLLKFNGKPITTTYAVYNNNGVEYPAYCLNVNLPGVGEEGNYSVINAGCISELGLWRIIINGYPYKSLKELGVQSEEEAFTATKQAVYCYLYDRGTEKYEAIGEAGERTLNALNMILQNGRNSNENKRANIIDIKRENDSWEQDGIDNKYVSKIYYIEAGANIKDYTVELEGKELVGTKVQEGEELEGIKVTSLDNQEKNIFSKNERFKILIPIDNLQNNGTFKIKVNTEVETKPVIYGKSEDESKQDYALTAYMFEDSLANLEETYNKNITKIVIYKKENDTEKMLEKAEFSILNEEKKEVYSGLVTNKNGEVLIEGIMPGKYYIKEINAPMGYIKYDEPIEIEIKLNETIKVVVNNGKQEKPEDIKTPLKEVEVEQEVKEEVEISEQKVEQLPNITEVKVDRKVIKQPTIKEIEVKQIKEEIIEIQQEIQKQKITEVKKLPKTGM